MKEIKAYVRPVKVAEILHHLEAVGVRDLTADTAATRHLGRWYAPGRDLTFCPTLCTGEGLYEENQPRMCELAERVVGNITSAGLRLVRRSE